MKKLASMRLRRLMFSGFGLSMLSFAFVGCGDDPSKKGGEVVPVPAQQVEATKNMEEFMKGKK